jgi:nitrate reductase beta subunit
VKRSQQLGEAAPAAAASEAGMSLEQVERLFRLLALAPYDERYVIPQTHGEIGLNPHSRQGACGLDFEGGPGSCGALSKAKDPFGAEPLAAPAAGGASNVAFLDFRKDA